MLFDESNEHEPDPPHEPKEGEIGPDIPEVDIPKAPNTDLVDRDVPKDVQRKFWTLVGIFNVALFATSLGVMLVAFERQWVFGGSLAFLGLGAFFFGWQRYQRIRNE